MLRSSGIDTYITGIILFTFSWNLAAGIFLYFYSGIILLILSPSPLSLSPIYLSGLLYT